MKDPIFTGLGVAIVTPFRHETVDLAALRRLLDWQITCGTNAIIVCGTTGEATTLTYGERMRTVECCVEHVNGRVPVIAGTGSNSTEVAITLSRDAQRAGADGCLVVTPYYNKATQPGLERHFQVIADAVEKPIILYNVPSRTGVCIAPETYAALSNHPNIIGVKEASGNLSNLQKTRTLCPDDFYIWSGNDEETVPICALGGVGVISVAANIQPVLMRRLTELCLANDFAAAGKLQLELKELCDMLFCEVNPIPVKSAMGMMGLCEDTVRLPLCPPTATHEALIRSTLRQYGLLPE